MPKLKVIGIHGKQNSPKAIAAAEKAIQYFEKKGIQIQLNKKFHPKKGKYFLSEFNCDAVLSFGGDGSLLATFHKLRKDIPVLGVNFGRKGYLLEETESSFWKKIDDFTEGKFEITELTRLRALADGTILPPALNDITLVPKHAGRLIRYRIDLDNEFIGTQGSDGFLICTPTGSTGHNVSAGGPVIKSQPNIFGFVEFNSIDLKNNSIIVPDTFVIRAYHFERGEVEVVIDGQRRYPVKKELVIKKGPIAKLIKLR
ncbi:MAG: NAD(+)/NADH kinase [Candidatus Diapherotrites archaeon]